MCVCVQVAVLFWQVSANVVARAAFLRCFVPGAVPGVAAGFLWRLV